MKLLIIGSGLSGAVLANKFAKKGKKVVILEKRNQISGNVYDKKIEGITTQMYGPHIFHTNNKEVYEYMNNFWELNNFKNKVEGSVKDKIIPIPFNFVGIDTFWPSESKEIKEKFIKKYGEDVRVSIWELLKEKDEQLKKVANFVYKNIFENYTTKMWGKDPLEIDKWVLKRVPVTTGYNSRYFSDKYEGIPKQGYTEAIKKMIKNNNNIEIHLKTNAVDVLDLKEDGRIFFKEKEVTCPIIYTGPLDELFNYKYGILSYRSLKIDFEILNQKHFQKTAVVNYPNHPTMTRITEYKNLTLEQSQKTVISKEYPGEFSLGSKDFGIPYYPMADDKSREQYNNYKKQISKYPNIIPLGRLATFEYLNMDKIIENALKLCKELLEHEK